MIDPELVTRKMVLITQDLTAMEPFARKELADYLASPLDELVVERLLERIVGRMIDVNYHLLTETGQPPPPDYYQSFLQLTRLGVLDHELAPRVASCAGLRNRIVHEYDELDPRKVYEALQALLRDIPTYLQRLDDYLRRAAS